MSTRSRSSSGHKLGQLVGDWFEEYVAVGLLKSVAEELGLYLDHRFRERKCRAGKIIWTDIDGNQVDYDFVLELGGSDESKGIPLAFFETFWRRGTRHSKDKARDDSGKLMPMRDTYPTARVLGIISAGDFSKPAQELVSSRAIDLFYIPKAKISDAWRACGVEMDYIDSASEATKRNLADIADRDLTIKKKAEILDTLVELVGKPTFDSYIQRTVASLAAIPIVYRVTPIYVGDEIEFVDFDEATRFLKDSIDGNLLTASTRLFKYGVLFSDGKIFERTNLDLENAMAIHTSVGQVASYFQDYHAARSTNSRTKN